MQHINKRTAISAAILAALCVTSAIAQGNNDISSSSTDYKPSGYILPSISRMSPDTRLGTDKNATGGSLRFGAPVSPNVDLQFGLQYGRSTDGSNRYEQMTLGLDGVYLFSRSRFRPLVLVGVGAQRDQVTTSSSKVNATSPFVGAGVGFQFAFNDQWGMQLDARRNYAFLQGNNFASKRSNTDIVSLGLMYTFDKSPQRAARVVQVPVDVVPPSPVVAQSPAPQPPIIVVAPPAPAPVAMPAPAKFERITLSASKLFDFDSAVLRTPMPKLDEVADSLVKYPDVGNIMISGYTDRLGSDAYNQVLSQKRADAVKSYMVNRGVTANRMTATGKGESNPMVNCTEKNIAKLRDCLEPNRRVEIEQITIERQVR